MVDPIALENLFFGTLSGAAVVLMGAFYALFFALGKLHSSLACAIGSLVAFALLIVSVLVLVMSLQLAGVWRLVAGVMLAGYFVGPRIIWTLCVATHDHGDGDVPGQTW